MYGRKMVKIIRYEVYTDNGDGWQLLDQFSGDERQNASFCAKEVEAGGRPVKIIREIYETDDGSFQETVEYVGGLSNKSKGKNKPVTNTIFDNLKGEYNVEATPFKMLASNLVSKAVIKLILVIAFSLLLANILTTLSVPVVEFMVPDEQRKSVLFFGFFGVFILIAVPLLFYKIPWNVFYSLRKGDKELIDERKFFRRATSLMSSYNLNDNGREVITPVFPEAPLEYRQYVLNYLSQVLNNLDTEIKMSDSFNRLGVKLVIYGGCLELSRYGHLVWAEANSLLYDAFKVLEGDKVDLQGFYDAKRSYRDNKVAVFLTGVGAYLMAQVINGIPMDAQVLKITMDKWVSFNTQPEKPETPAAEQNAAPEEREGKNIIFECLVNFRLTVNIFDEEKAIGEAEQNAVNSDIRDLINRLSGQYRSGDILEEEGITSLHFANLGRAVQFVEAFASALEDYKERRSEYTLLIDCKTAVTEIPEDKGLDLNAYIKDILEYAYNNEVIVNSVIKDELLGSAYGFEFLGEKALRRSNVSAPLYKMSF